MSSIDHADTAERLLAENADWVDSRNPPNAVGQAALTHAVLALTDAVERTLAPWPDEAAL